MLKSADLLHKWGLGDSVMNSTVCTPFKTFNAKGFFVVHLVSLISNESTERPVKQFPIFYGVA